jgi:hypothetical protein
MLLHRLATLAITIALLAATAALLAATAVGAIAWRLSQGPVDIPWLAGRLEAAANADGGPTRLAIGSVALTWEGFRLGVDRPLDLRVTNATVIDQAGGRRVNIPRAEVSLSLYELMFGRIAPRAVEVDGPQFTLLRASDGTLSLDLGSLAEATDSGEPTSGGQVATGRSTVAGLLAVLARPPVSDRDRNQNSLFSQLRTVRIRDARVVVIDRQLGVTWQAPQAEINLSRRPQGGVDGTADLSLVFGEQQARLTASATLAPGATETHLRVRLTPVMPSVVARAAPTLAVLSAVDAPVTSEADLDLDANLSLRKARVTLRAGAGEVRIGQSGVPIVDAALIVSGTPDALALQTLQVSLRGHTGGPQTLVAMRGTLQREAGRLNAAASVDLDQMDFADLAQLWPPGIAAHARSWIVENIPIGMARNGHIDIGIAAPEDLSSAVITRASGTLDGDGLQVHWLRPIPPIDNGKAQLRIVDPDTLDIFVASGRQVLRNQRESSTGGLQIRGGKVRITGLLQPDQIATIDADITGPLADALALLREPRLALLDRHPIELRNPAGQATVKLTVGVPLDNSVRMDDIKIRAQGHLDGVHLGAVAAGRDIDQGVFDLDVTTDGLKLNGRALFASIPVRLEAAMDFRAGGPAQVQQSVTISGQPDARQLAAAGLDATSVLSGPIQVQGTLTEHRNGRGELAVTADLASAELVVAPLEWRKPGDVPAKASARLTLDHDRLIGIDNVQLNGGGLAVRGRGEFRDGRLAQVLVDQLMLGRTVAQGTVRLPEQSGAGPIVVSLTGATLDLAQRLGRHTPARKPPQTKAEPPQGPRWNLDARFDRVLMAQDSVISDVVLHAENDGRVFQQMRIEGRTGPMAPVLLQIIQQRTGRRFAASAVDAGALLRGLDIVRTMQGGRLSVEAHYDDGQPGRPLTGTADIEEFRIRNAPALAKLLQAMTLYGLVELMQGPGLGFSRLVAPFRLTDDALDLSDARAFSPSLGLTAKGRIDLADDQIDMQGTIVPAYFFNTLLGNIPLVGKLFSPERGGGLFAASYAVHGALNDPTVSVNPLTALTPGFLRGVFGIF